MCTLTQDIKAKLHSDFSHRCELLDESEAGIAVVLPITRGWKDIPN
jgi:hypothetical protein